MVAALVLISSNCKANAEGEDQIKHHHFKERPRLITVTGNADIKVPPSKAVINFSIKNTDKSAEKVRISNNDASKAVLNSIRKLGIPENKIHFENLSIQEEYEYNNKTGQSTLKGYKAYRTFNIEIDKNNSSKTLAELASEIVTAVVTDNSNQLESIEYGLIDREKIKTEVIQLACKNAKEKAEGMLKALGANLGQVQSIRESGSMPMPYSRRNFPATKMLSMASAAEQAPTDAEAFSEGDLEVNANVEVVFEIQ